MVTIAAAPSATEKRVIRVKQILTARECARLNKRMNYGAVLPFYTIVQSTQHPCTGTDRPRLPVLCITAEDEDGKTFFAMQVRNLASAKIVRQYLFDTLPAWPDVDDMPSIDGFVVDDGFWYELARGSNNAVNWMNRPSGQAVQA